MSASRPCECPPTAQRGERCSAKVVRCNAGLAALRPRDEACGVCPACGWFGRLRRDGTMRAHRIGRGYGWRHCDGGGKPPRGADDGKRDLVQELCDLVAEAGLTMTLHGQAVDAAGLRAAAEASFKARVVEKLAEATASDWEVPRREAPVALAGNEDADWHLEPGEIDP